MLALGVPFAVRTLVQAAALAIGVAIYTVDWAAVRRRFVSRPKSRGTRDHLRIPPHPERGAPRETPCDAAVARITEENMNYRRISAAVAAVGLAALVLAGCSSDSGGGERARGIGRHLGRGRARLVRTR